MAEHIDRTRLSIYLNDHLTGATTGLRLAHRALGENRDNEYGAALQGLIAEIEEDRELLLEVMRKLDVVENPLKKLAGWAMERAGLLKLNDEWRSYSPLSRLLELEMLLLGSTGSRCLWQTLELIAVSEPVLSEFDFQYLQERAGRRASRFAQLRLDARLPAFARKEPRQEAAQAQRRQTTTVGRTTATYAGQERRSGEERRMRHVFTPVATERRMGTDRRVPASELRR